MCKDLLLFLLLLLLWLVRLCDCSCVKELVEEGCTTKALVVEYNSALVTVATNSFEFIVMLYSLFAGIENEDQTGTR